MRQTSTQQVRSDRATTATTNHYSTWSTLALVGAVARDADRGALHALVGERSVFTLGGQSCLLPQFLLGLRNARLQRERANGAAHDVEERVDQAYDQTLSRFLSLPEQGDVDGLSAIDCRHQYLAARDCMASWRQLHPDAGMLQEEEKVSGLLQALVYKHFQYGWLDACRNRPLETRYFLSAAEHGIELRRPIRIDPITFRAWLEARYCDRDLSIPGTRDQIQRDVDETFGRDHLERWGPHFEVLSQETERDSVVDGQTRVLLDDLARLVAAEKSANLAKQRDSIRKLGKDKLYELCYRTICEVVAGEHQAQRLAKDLGLTKTAMSRFAGTQWSFKITDVSRVPDLWANTAHLMVSDRRFTEGLVAEDVAGVMPRLQRMAAGGHHE
jgi:hypothetical protein